MKPRPILFVSHIALEVIYNSLSVIGIHPGSSEGDVIENLIKMFKQKKIGQLSSGKDLSIQLNTEDMVTLFKDKEKENNKRL